MFKILDGTETRLVIPLYQRNYDWKETNCERFFTDVCNLIAKGDDVDRYFFGCIVRKPQSGEVSTSLIIDGQQRITTVSLFLAAILEAAGSKKIECQDKSNLKRIKSYLVDEYDESVNKLKLKPIDNDKKAFDAIVLGETEKVEAASNVTRNYNLLLDLITEKTSLTADDY